MTPFGWPQLVIYCTTKNSEGEDMVKAYGSIHVPIEPGMHKKTVRMFSPISGNSCMEFFGVYPEGSGIFIDQPELIARAEGREVSRVKAGGKITVSLHVTQRNMARHGYITTNNKK
jgi:B9 domain-containing protein 1